MINQNNTIVWAYLCSILGPNLGQNGAEHLVPLLQHLEVLTDEVARDRKFHVTLGGRGVHSAPRTIAYIHNYFWGAMKKA